MESLPSLGVRPSAAIFGCALLLLTAAACGSPTKPSPGPSTNPPAIACPATTTASSLDGQPIPVTYSEPTVTGGKAPLTKTCAPASGTTFVVGTTAVTCTVTDAQLRTSSCAFPVTVIVPIPPRLRVTSFVAFGDSITWGENGSNSTLQAMTQPGHVHKAVQFPLAETYPGALERELTLRYTTQRPTVANEGLGGEKVTGPLTLSRFSGVIAGGRYGAVLIMEGANDLYVSGDSNIEPAVIYGLRQMILDAKSRGVKPYLATIPPEFDGCCPNRGKRHDMVPGFNNLVRMLAVEQAVTLVDVYEALNTNPKSYIGFDGLHPNAAGYAKIADTFLDAISRTLEASPTTTQLQSWQKGPGQTK